MQDALLHICDQLALDDEPDNEEWRTRASIKSRRLQRGLGNIKNLLIERRSNERSQAVMELVASVRELLADDECEVAWRRMELAIEFFNNPNYERKAS